jgi:hypothetical protein
MPPQAFHGCNWHSGIGAAINGDLFEAARSAQHAVRCPNGRTLLTLENVD